MKGDDICMTRAGFRIRFGLDFWVGLVAHMVLGWVCVGHGDGLLFECIGHWSFWRCSLAVPVVRLVGSMISFRVRPM